MQSMIYSLYERFIKMRLVNFYFYTRSSAQGIIDTSKFQ